MFKRLMIGLFALSLAVIWLSEANAYVYRRRSVGVTVRYGSDVILPGDTVPFDVYVNGLAADANGNCGEVKGDLYCAASGTPILECLRATGDSAALVLVADIDLIKETNPPDYLYPYYDWTRFGLNADIADFGQRRQLRVFAEMALYGNTDTGDDPSDPAIITLPTGKTDNKAGIYAITDETVEYWKTIAPAVTTDSAALRRFIGTGSPVLRPDCGFGVTSDDTGCAGISTDQYLQDIPGGLVPIAGNNLADLRGQTGCIAVHFDNLKSGDDLHGKYRGLIAVKFLSTTNDSVTMEVLDVNDVCRSLPLYNDYVPVAAASTTGTGCSTGEVATVFAPAPHYYDSRDVVSFEMDDATAVTTCEEQSLNGYTYTCQTTVEVVSDGTDGLGNDLCSGDYPHFVEFIPTDRNGSAFIGTVEPREGYEGIISPEVVECREGGAVGDVPFSRYVCETYTGGNPPDCYGAAQRPWTIGESYDDSPCD